MIRHIAVISTLATVASGALMALPGPASANDFAIDEVYEGVHEARARWLDNANRLCANDLAFDDWPVRASVRKPNGAVAFVWDQHPGDGPTCRVISVRENAPIKIKACRPYDRTKEDEFIFRCSAYQAGTS